MKTQTQAASGGMQKKPVKKPVPLQENARSPRISVSIVRNDFDDEHVLVRKAWHAQSCDYSIPAADLLSAVISMYDADPEHVIDGETCTDDFYLSYCLWHDARGDHGYVALLNYLQGLGLITWRQCYDTKCQHVAICGMYYVKLQVGAIEQWLEENKGWEVQAPTA